MPISSTPRMMPLVRATGATPAVASSTTPANPPLKVITFNTAVGNPKITTRQADFPKLPFYQAVINGKPDAPILCLQEVGKEQKEAVEALSKNGQFTVRAMRVGLDQYNMVMIPKRFQMEDYDSERFGLGQIKAAAKSVWGWIRGQEKPNVSQLVEPRGFQEVKLRDTATGKAFTLFNTHISFMENIQIPQARKLFQEAHEAAKHGAVIVAGDLNARTAETDPHPNGKDAKVRNLFGDFVDMGPKGTPPGKTNIDYVLAKGFDSVESKWYTGDSLSLPGSPDAKAVSDHYAEEDTLLFR